MPNQLKSEIQEARENELFRNELAELFQNATLQRAIAITNRASPSNGGVKEWGQPHIAHIQLGIDRGFNLYPQVLLSLAQPWRAPDSEVPATYEAPPVEDEGKPRQ